MSPSRAFFLAPIYFLAPATQARDFVVVLKWLDIVFHGQYLPSLSVSYVAISKDLEKLTPQLY